MSLADQADAMPCPTHLLEDRPASRDSFGPHGEVANALADVLLNEAGGRAIGLEGSWGAGKSTVIEILRSALGNNEHARLWIFDAWAHEGDPLRRNFLESLSSFLCAEDWADKATSEARVDKLTRRSKTSTQTTTPLLSGFGAFMAVALVLVPIGFALLSHALRAGMTLAGGGQLMAAGVAGWLLSLSPLLLLAGRWAFWYLPSSRTLSPSAKNELRAELFAVLSQRGVVKTRTDSIETVEPTSLEFGESFATMMREALGSHEVRRLVIVLDNLDRVDPRSALAIWSTLQTFLHGGAAEVSWRRRFWVLLPFDRQSMARLWTASNPEVSADAARAHAFLDKTFQISFPVPFPLLSHWQEFMRDALITALPRHSDRDTLHKLLRLTHLRYEQAGRHITPREIKILVNQIGALHRIRQSWHQERGC